MDARGVVVRRATVADAAVVAGLLDDFNREFDTPTPGAEALTDRLSALLVRDEVWALLAETGPAAGQVLGVALVTLRPNVWYDGPVAMLDELYVVPERRAEGIGSALLARLFDDAAERSVSAIEIEVDEPDTDAQRFYRRHGFTDRDPDTGDRASLFRRDLAP
jgi:GNAT superfamily N-acetyltransferase